MIYKMAKRKRKYTKRSTNNNLRRNTNESNFAVIGTIIFSVLLAVLLYANSGAVGQKLNEMLGGLIGILRYILPIGSFALAIKMAVEDEEDFVAKRLVQYAILIICIAIIMSVHQISTGAIQTTGDMSQIMKKAYTLGASNQGGGAIGTLAAVFLVKMLGNLGAIVLSLGISIMLFVFVGGIDVANIIGKMAENYKERKDEKEILKEEKRKEREEYITMRRKELQAQRQAKEEKLRMNKENAATQENNGQQISPEQIKINLNGRVVEDDTKPTSKGLKGLIKKVKKEEETKPSIAQTASSIMQIDTETGEILEENNNLFVQEEEQKQDKTKQVLQLEHTMAVEEDNYVFPPVEILGEVEKPSLKGGTQSLKNPAEKLQKTL